MGPAWSVLQGSPGRSGDSAGGSLPALKPCRVHASQSAVAAACACCQRCQLRGNLQELAASLPPTAAHFSYWLSA